MASNSTSRPGMRAKVLDQAARDRRIIQQLQRLQDDNYREMSDASDDEIFAPSFKKKQKKLKIRRQAGKYKKNFTALLEEELANCPPGEPNYVTAVVPPAKYPKRHFCSVCGLMSSYTCVQCGAYFCCIRCDGIHKETRCLKYCL